VYVVLDAEERSTFPVESAVPRPPVEPLFGPSGLELPFLLMVGGRPFSFAIVSATPEPPCTTLHLRGRAAGSNFVADLWGTVCPGTSVVPFELLLVNSSPTNDAIYETATVTLAGLPPVATFLWWPQWRGVVGDVLLDHVTTADTQGHAWAGYLALEGDTQGAAWQYGPTMAFSPPVEWRGKWGPFGVIPEFGFTEAAYRAEMDRWRGTMATPRGPWAAPDLGLAPTAGQTGGQQDFGATKLGPALTLPGGAPLHAFHALQAAYAEAHRPGGFREADGTAVWPAFHPNWVTWAAYTHFHPSVSSDRLGKGTQPTPSWGGGWTGKDRQHWSSNNLCGAYSLTGSPLLLALIEREARQILSGETLDPRLSTSGIGAPRGIGRTLLTAAWIDCCLPDGELRLAMRERVRARCELIEAATRPAPGVSLAPLGLQIDPRVLGGITAVQPWQEALGIIGLRAAELRFGGATAVACKATLARVCPTFIDHGWWQSGVTWLMADAFAWNNGQPLPASAYPGPLVERNEGFEEWSWGAVMISVRFMPDSDRAARILVAMPPAESVADAEWRAVR
jgi:hypothetical protein